MKLLAALINLPTPFWCVWFLTVVWLASAFALGFLLATARRETRHLRAVRAAFLDGVRAERADHARALSGGEIL